MTVVPGPLRTPMCDLLGCAYPIILAGMGGVARAELAAAVASAGGFPTLGMVREAPSLIASEISAYRRLSNRPFAVNLIPAATDPGLLDQQIETCLAMEVGVFSFFWDVVPEAVARVKEAGALLLHQVGTLPAARAAEAAGADVLIAQGQDAGGHVHGHTPTFDLLRAVLETTALPVVASGGISNGKGLARALSLGAQGVQCGTAFLATAESFAHDYHKQRVVTAEGKDTVLTDGFVLNWPKGSAVRVLRNSVTEAFGPVLIGHDPERIAHEVIAYDGSNPRLRQSTDSPLRTTTGDLEQMPLYCGTGAGEIDSIVPAAQRLNTLCAEARARLASARQTPTVGQT
ncbi:nitronate monooxygenase [Aquicoccus sp. SCR17]|nr:nitronate monooxygenase [Carideicomes alvinocaridis]